MPERSAERPYRATVTRQTKLVDRLFGTKYLVTVYRRERFVALDYAGRLADVMPTVRRLVRDHFIDEQIDTIETSFDFADKLERGRPRRERKGPAASGDER